MAQTFILSYVTRLLDQSILAIYSYLRKNADKKDTYDSYNDILVSKQMIFYIF